MGILRHCDEIWGADTLIESDPAEEICYGAIYNPFRKTLWLSDPEWGVFHEDGRQIDAAAYYRLPAKFRVGQGAHLPMAERQIESAPRGDYVYGGPVIFHYGHFITAFLPRLWQIVRQGISPATKIVCHSDHHPDDWFARDYAREILSALGLGPECFVRPEHATRLRRLRIPRPAFEEQNFAHRVFRQLGRRIGSTFRSEKQTLGPVYLSKTLLRLGTYKIGNEAALDDAIAAKGIAIVRPEKLSFRQQLAVLSSTSTIIGSIGSAFHTALFCAEPPRSIGLAYENKVNANYRLIDRLTGVDATYVYPSHGLASKPLAGITFGYWLEDPSAVADELLQFL